jgi:dihydroorotase
MQEAGLPLLLHGEVTDPRSTCSTAKRCSSTHPEPLLRTLPRLKVVLEHITTRQAAEFVAAAPANVAATVTAHHLLYNRNAMFQGGIRPHYYCLPVLKRESHRAALLAAATSGNPKFFLGTDSAPHTTRQGSRLRLRRHLHRACGHGTVRRSFRRRRRARQAGSLRQLPRRGFLWPAAQ